MHARLAPAYSSKSQGSVERWHRELWGHVKTLKEQLQDNYGTKVSTNSEIMTWIVKHSSWLYNRYQQHTDGKTSYERCHGTTYNKPIAQFGETVMFHYGIVDTKTTPTWTKGIWLGRCTQSDEHYVVDEN